MTYADTELEPGNDAKLSPFSGPVRVLVMSRTCTHLGGLVVQATYLHKQVYVHMSTVATV